MRLRHVGITVTHLENSIAFYERFFGFRIVKRMIETGPHINNFSGLKGVEVETVKMSAPDESMIELLYYHSHPKIAKAHDITNIGCSHFALTVKNLNDLYEKLLDSSIVVLCEPQHSPDGKAMVLFCKDPDGTLIELVQEVYV